MFPSLSYNVLLTVSLYHLNVTQQDIGEEVSNPTSSNAILFHSATIITQYHRKKETIRSTAQMEKIKQKKCEDNDQHAYREHK